MSLEDYITTITHTDFSELPEFYCRGEELHPTVTLIMEGICLLLLDTPLRASDDVTTRVASLQMRTRAAILDAAFTRRLRKLMTVAMPLRTLSRLASFVSSDLFNMRSLGKICPQLEPIGRALVIIYDAQCSAVMKKKAEAHRQQRPIRSPVPPPELQNMPEEPPGEIESPRKEPSRMMSPTRPEVSAVPSLSSPRYTTPPAPLLAPPAPIIPRALIHQASRGELVEARRAFDVLDTERRGMLDFNRLCAGLVGDFTEADLRKTFRRLTKSKFGNDCIDFDAFAGWWLGHRNMLQPLGPRAASSVSLSPPRAQQVPRHNLNPTQLQKIQSAFDCFDTERKGCLNAAQMRDCVQALGLDITNAELAEVFFAIDTNSDGFVGLEDFAQWWGTGRRSDVLSGREANRHPLDPLKQRWLLACGALRRVSPAEWALLRESFHCPGDFAPYVGCILSLLSTSERYKHFRKSQSNPWPSLKEHIVFPQTVTSVLTSLQPGQVPTVLMADMADLFRASPPFDRIARESIAAAAMVQIAYRLFDAQRHNSSESPVETGFILPAPAQVSIALCSPPRPTTPGRTRKTPKKEPQPPFISTALKGAKNFRVDRVPPTLPVAPPMRSETPPTVGRALPGSRSPPRPVPPPPPQIPLPTEALAKASQLSSLLTNHHLERYIPLFERNEIDIYSLPHLKDSDYDRLGIPLGPRRLLQALVGTPGAPRARTPSQRVGSRVSD